MYQQAFKKFLSEFKSLKAIEETKTVMVPSPMVIDKLTFKTSFIALKYLKVNKFKASSSAKLGSQLADLHLYNLRGKTPKVKQFGFNISTIAGEVEYNNTWTKDWIV